MTVVLRAKWGKNYTISNIITNGSYENGNTGWGGMTEITITTAKSYKGTHSAALNPPSGSVNMSSQPISNSYITAGHKYYNRYYYFATVSNENLLVNIFCNGGTCGGSREASYLLAISTPVTGSSSWKMLSGIYAKNTLDSGIQWNYRVYSSGNKNIIYVDCHMLIDLTTAFGAGYEPDKTFMDNIEYFEGSTSVYYVR